jgi:hypothetical protein
VEICPLDSIERERPGKFKSADRKPFVMRCEQNQYACSCGGIAALLLESFEVTALDSRNFPSDAVFFAPTTIATLTRQVLRGFRR